jgi:hypothetical protein
MEVLGAVAILGISYIMLATFSIQGLRLIGESSRRSDASLLADRLLTEIELKAEVGQLIDIGTEELDEEPFTVVVEILDLAEEYEGSISGGEAGDLLAFLAAEANGPFKEFRESNWLLGYLREIHVNVTWQEGANEITVSRTAYVYDQEAWMENEQAQSAADADAENNGGRGPS